MKTINWIEEYENYMNFLELEINEMKNEDDAKKGIKEEIENIISLNGEEYLYEYEKDLLNKLK